ncbi:hypothetical protein AMELA_G00068950 [Ameiurus melas]|uniref:Uncharacterized protein n=1 Tax=Ameiurus melas TaxID=219545 RepID=A0A7J6B7H6_AMEME|nr:hypothetical protein AMELA_G00068950 [Ameiurus melas]
MALTQVGLSHHTQTPKVNRKRETWVNFPKTEESHVERLSVESSWSDMNGKEWK